MCFDALHHTESVHLRYRPNPSHWDNPQNPPINYLLHRISTIPASFPDVVTLPWIPILNGLASLALMWTNTSKSLGDKKLAIHKTYQIDVTCVHCEFHIFKNTKCKKIHFHFDESNVSFTKCLSIQYFLNIIPSNNFGTGPISLKNTTDLVC